MNYFLEQIRIPVKLAVDNGTVHKRHTRAAWLRAAKAGSNLGYGEWVAANVIADFVDPVAPEAGVVVLGTVTGRIQTTEPVPVKSPPESLKSWRLPNLDMSNPPLVQ